MQIDILWILYENQLQVMTKDQLDSNYLSYEQKTQLFSACV